MAEQFNPERALNAARERSTARAKARGEAMPTIEALPLPSFITPEVEAAISKLPTVVSEPDELRSSFKELSKLQIENDAASAAGIAEEFKVGDRARAVRSAALIRQSIRNVPPAPDFMIAGSVREFSEAEIAALCRLPAYGSPEWQQTAPPEQLKAYLAREQGPKLVNRDDKPGLTPQEKFSRDMGIALAGPPLAALLAVACQQDANIAAYDCRQGPLAALLDCALTSM